MRNSTLYRNLRQKLHLNIASYAIIMLLFIYFQTAYGYAGLDGGGSDDPLYAKIRGGLLTIVVVITAFG
jgi:hypothetical protein